jgi:hypothetical protein
MSVTLTIELESLAQASVITEALRHEIETLTNATTYYETAAAKPFSQAGIAVEDRQEARAKHEANQLRMQDAFEEKRAKLELVQQVWDKMSS